MKLKKIFAALAATAVAATMAVSASAADVQVDCDKVVKGDVVYFSLTDNGYNPLEVESVTFTISVDDSDGFGGGLMIQSDINSWEQKDGEWDWGNEGKNFNAEGGDGVYTLTFNWGDYFTASGLDSIEWAQVVIQQWWGNDITITDVAVKTADAPADPTPADPTPADPADPTPAEPSDNNQPTGATAGLALAGLALAGAALVATKKSK